MGGCLHCLNIIIMSYSFVLSSWSPVLSFLIFNALGEVIHELKRIVSHGLYCMCAHESRFSWEREIWVLFQPCSSWYMLCLATMYGLSESLYSHVISCITFRSLVKPYEWCSCISDESFFTFEEAFYSHILSFL